MLGAIVGDIVGSAYEFDNIKTKDFPLFSKDGFLTDDSIMTLAIGKSIMEAEGDLEKLSELSIKNMRTLGRKYPYAGYGGRFARWLMTEDPVPYWSFGNGSAMRVSACGNIAKTLEEAKALSKAVTKVTHNHPEGLKGAEATSVAIFLAKSGKSKEEIKEYILENYYKIDFTLNEIRENYKFNETCQGSVPEALEAFFESTSFEDSIRNAISLGGDSDTIGAITGSISEMYYGIPNEIREKAISYMDEFQKKILFDFEKKYDFLKP